MTGVQFCHHFRSQVYRDLYLIRILMIVIAVCSGFNLIAYCFPFHLIEITACSQGFPSKCLENNMQVAGPTISRLGQSLNFILISDNINPEMNTGSCHEFLSFRIRKTTDIVSPIRRNVSQIHPTGRVFGIAEACQHQYLSADHNHHADFETTWRGDLLNHV